MATVYLADDLKHERKVALKVLKPELAAVVGAERFLAEIKTTANLQHPHILPLFDSGEADSFLFYVMPYVEGETLQDRIDREKQLPVDEAVALASKVAGALQHAHEHGVIHRDIKPGNILLQAGEPVVADFGIALAVGAAGSNRLTETGLSLGTPYYMSPEQATGDQVVGASTDTYALGSVLYEMLVGEPPYPGTTAQAVLGKIIAGKPVSATEHRPSIPANVDAAVQKALEKLPADRFKSAQDFVRALGDEHFRHGATVAAGSLGSRGLWNPVSIGATALTVVFAALWLLARATTDASTAAPNATVLTMTMPEGVALNSAHMAISPDGRTLVYRGSGELYRREFGRLEAVPIPGTDGTPWMPFFDPTGEWIGFFDTTENTLKRVRLDGSEFQTIADAPSTTRSGDWGEDGTIVYHSTGLGGLVRLAAGGEVELIESSAPSLAWIDLLPGGEAVLGTTFTTEDIITLIRLDSGEIERLFPGTMARYVAGAIVYWRDDSLWAVPFDVERLRVTGEPTLVVQGVRSASNGVARFVVSEDVLAYQAGRLTGNSFFGMPVWVDRDGNETPLAIDPGLYNWPRISPDGTKVAFTRLQENEDVVVYDLGTGVLTPITVDPARDATPIWTPDGERIVFRSTRNGASNLYSRRADGGDAVVPLTESSADQRPIEVTLDGSTLLFEEVDYEAGEGAAYDVWSLPLDPDPGAAPVLLMGEAYAEGHPAVSPDGRFIAYQSSAPGYPEIFVSSYPDLVRGRMVSTLDIGRQISATNADAREARAPVWSRDGTELFYQSGTAVVSIPMTTEGTPSGVPQEAFRGGAWPFVGEGRHYDVHPDGRFLRIRLVAAADSDAPANELIVVQNWMELVRQRRGN